MKIAIAGKGGVGKTTVCAALAVLYAREGQKVIAVDADPSPNLALSLGVSREKRKQIVPISRMLDLIEERTGVKPGETIGSMYVMNPRVDDIVGKYGIDCIEGIKLLVLGTVTQGGSGCFCPENALLRSLIRHLVLDKDCIVVMDMEAGVEHLGRSTAQNVDILLIVIEPSIKSIEIAGQIKKLANDIGITRVAAVLNKCSTGTEKGKVEMEMNMLGIPVLGSIRRDEGIAKADFDGKSPFADDRCSGILDDVSEIRKKLVQQK